MERKDIDIWLFFEEDVRTPIPDIRNMRRTVSLPYRRLGEKPTDMMKKTIKPRIIAMSEDRLPREIIRAYLQYGGTQSSNYLAQQSVVGLHPADIFGEVLWRV